MIGFVESMTSQMVSTSNACSVTGRPLPEDSVAGRADIQQMRSALSDTIAAAPSQMKQCSNEPSTKQTPELEREPLTARDSGYSSLVNSPHSPNEGTKSISRKLLKPKKLRRYDKPIDQPTQTRFLDLKVLFGRTLHEFLAKKKVTFTAIQMRLSILGEDEASAKPCIIIACEKATLKRVKQFFDQVDIKEELQPNTSEWPAFKLIICDRAPRLLTTDIDMDIDTEIFGLDLNFIEGLSAPSACGMTIKAAVGEKTRTATLGGIIEVLSKTGEIKSYGLTAGHILLGGSVLGASENELEVQSGDEDGMDTDDSQAESYISQETLFQLPDRPCLNHPFSASSEEEFETLFGYGSISPGNHLASQGQEEESGEDKPSYSTNLGRIVAHSGQSKPSIDGDCNQDWALIELHEAQSDIGNYLIDGRGSSAPHPLQLTQVVEENDLQMDGERPVGVIRTSPSPSWGVLSRAWSFIMISPGNAFTETYTLTLGPKSGELCDFLVSSPLFPLISLIGLRTGDSGSWVFDCQTHNVYGHVVAVDLFGEGIVVPMHAILMDIKQKLNAAAVWLRGLRDRLNGIGSIQQTPRDETHEIEISAGSDSSWPDIRDPFFDSAYASADPSPQLWVHDSVPHDYVPHDSVPHDSVPYDSDFHDSDY